MVFIPPPHLLQQKPGTPQKPATQHDLTVGMFVGFVISLCVAIFIFVAGPRSNNPPPLAAGLAVSGLALIFGIIAFFSWMKEQGEPDASGGGDAGSEE